MKILKHYNFIHSYGKEETYNIFQQHYNRDTKKHLWWEIIFIIFAAGGIFTTGNYEWIWLFGGMFALERKLTWFIDNSNRNWTMHLIDWIEQGKVYGKEEEIDEDF
jgi:hypothetical protein